MSGGSDPSNRRHSVRRSPRARPDRRAISRNVSGSTSTTALIPRSGSGSCHPRSLAPARSRSCVVPTAPRAPRAAASPSRPSARRCSSPRRARAILTIKSRLVVRGGLRRGAAGTSTVAGGMASAARTGSAKATGIVSSAIASGVIALGAALLLYLVSGRVVGGLAEQPDFCAGGRLAVAGFNGRRGSNRHSHGGCSFFAHWWSP